MTQTVSCLFSSQNDCFWDPTAQSVTKVKDGTILNALSAVCYTSLLTNKTIAENYIATEHAPACTKLAYTSEFHLSYSKYLADNIFCQANRTIDACLLKLDYIFNLKSSHN